MRSPDSSESILRCKFSLSKSRVAIKKCHAKLDFFSLHCKIKEPKASVSFFDNQ